MWTCDDVAADMGVSVVVDVDVEVDVGMDVDVGVDVGWMWARLAFVFLFVPVTRQPQLGCSSLRGYFVNCVISCL